MAAEQRTMVLFAAPSRLAGDLADLSAALGPNRPVVVARELTKVYEEVWRGTLDEAVGKWTEPRGEITLVVAGAPEGNGDLSEALGRVETLVAGGVALSEAVRTVAEETGTRRRRLYEAALREM
jgi:16S rRNA (cytidine1402-2'-O)-methyltransferase